MKPIPNCHNFCLTVPADVPHRVLNHKWPDAVNVRGPFTLVHIVRTGHSPPPMADTDGIKRYKTDMVVLIVPE